MPLCRVVTSKACFSVSRDMEPARFALYFVTILSFLLCPCTAAASHVHLQDQQELEGSKFKKLCSDCGLVDKKFTVTDVDLMFAKVNLTPASGLRLHEAVVSNHLLF